VAKQREYPVFEGPTELFGVKVPSGVEVTVYHGLISDNHLDPFWYGGGQSRNSDIMALKLKNRFVFLDAPGDIKIFQDDRRIFGPWDLNKDELDAGDDWFTDIDAVSWYNNNWYELFYAIEEEEFSQAVDDSVCYDYREAMWHAISLLLDDSFWETEEEAS
jgi:hypothetical protein